MVPQGELADGAKTGFAAIASVEFGGHIAFRAEGLWTNSDLKGAFSGSGLPSSSDVTGSVKMIGGIGSVVLHLGMGPIQPYVLGGAGYYQQNVSEDVAGAVNGLGHLSAKTSKVGMHVGAGLKFRVIGLAAFAEARYITVNTDESRTNFIPYMACASRGIRRGSLAADRLEVHEHLDGNCRPDARGHDAVVLEHREAPLHALVLLDGHDQLEHDVKVRDAQPAPLVAGARSAHTRGESLHVDLRLAQAERQAAARHPPIAAPSMRDGSGPSPAPSGGFSSMTIGSRSVPSNATSCV